MKLYTGMQEDEVASNAPAAYGYGLSSVRAARTHPSRLPYMHKYLCSTSYVQVIFEIKPSYSQNIRTILCATQLYSGTSTRAATDMGSPFRQNAAGTPLAVRMILWMFTGIVFRSTSAVQSPPGVAQISIPLSFGTPTVPGQWFIPARIGSKPGVSVNVSE